MTLTISWVCKGMANKLEKQINFEYKQNNGNKVKTKMIFAQFILNN